MSRRKFLQPQQKMLNAEIRVQQSSTCFFNIKRVNNIHPSLTGLILLKCCWTCWIYDN